jgi:hypothetical protein
VYNTSLVTPCPSLAPTIFFTEHRRRHTVLVHSTRSTDARLGKQGRARTGPATGNPESRDRRHVQLPNRGCTACKFRDISVFNRGNLHAVPRTACKRRKRISFGEPRGRSAMLTKLPEMAMTRSAAHDRCISSCECTGRERAGVRVTSRGRRETTYRRISNGKRLGEPRAKAERS